MWYELTHGSVPDDSLAISEAGLNVGKGLWSDVKSHPSFLDTVDVHNLRTRKREMEKECGIQREKVKERKGERYRKMRSIINI